MKVAVVGRTAMLLEAARRIHAAGHAVPVVWTAAAEAFYGTGTDDFRRFAVSIGADFHDSPALNRPDNRDRLASYGCDIAISVNWPTLIGQAVLGLFPLGVLNAHAGDLPRYRGNACPNWAILNGESHVGLCVHQMAAELDAGPVVLRARFPLTADSYIGDVYDWLDKTIPALFAEAVDGLARGALTPQPQPDDPALILRAYPRRPEDSRVVWSWTVETILRMVRASSHPFSGAFTSLEGQERVTVWRAEAARLPGAFLAVPGQVCCRLDGDPVIAASDGLIRLTDVSVTGADGKRLDGCPAKERILSSLRNRLM